MNVYNHEIAREQRNFSGTENWYRHMFGILYTDGVQWLAEKLNCYWLIDEVAIHCKQFQSKESFMALSFETKKQHKGVLKITDGNGYILGAVSYDFTDLYVDSNNLEGEKGIRFFFVFDGGFNRYVLMLPSEY